VGRAEVSRIDGFLDSFNDEMAADIRVHVVRNTGGQPIERFSLDRAREIGLGQETDRHGLLILYDVEGGRMRIEVGSRLEGVFTDAFVGFLIREHLRNFAGTDRMAIGIRATLMMVFNRIRQSVMGDEYDPRTVEFIEDRRRLVVGGGTTANVAGVDTLTAFHNREATREERAYFAPQPTVAEAYARFEDWLAVGATPSNAPLFTGASQEWLRDLPITTAYGEYMVLLEHGQPHHIVERGNLAMLYYTATPFAPPHYFRKGPQGWQIDVIAEVLNSTPLVGFPYTWSTRYSRDEYSEQFGGLWQRAGRAGRIIGGDNRTLPIRSLPWQEKVVSLFKGDAWAKVPVRRPPPIDTLTLDAANAMIRNNDGHPTVAVFYYTSQLFEAGFFPQLIDLAQSMKSVRVLTFSLDASQDAHWISWLFERHQTNLDARWIHPWSEDQLRDWMIGLGVAEPVARRCSCPKALVFGSDGILRFTDQQLASVDGIRSALLPAE
jgi:hypothetical protein